MTIPGSWTVWVGIGLTLCVLLVFRRLLAFLLRLLLRSSVGMAGLALFAKLAPLPGITLGVNPVNGLILGLLGIPGFGLLLMLRWFLS